MKKQSLLAIISAFIFAFLFYKNDVGINLFIFEMLIFIWMIYQKHFVFKGLNNITIGLGLFLTALFTVITFSNFVITVNILVFMIWVGMMIYPKAKSLTSAMGLAFLNLPLSQIEFGKKILSSKSSGRSIGSYIWRTRIFFIPMIIIVVFLSIYSHSNPVFQELVYSVVDFLNMVITFFFGRIDFLIVWIFLLGLIISNFFIFRNENKEIIANDALSSDSLERKQNTKKHRRFKLNALEQEYKSAVFLLLVLNVLLLILNITDIKFVWFGFNWEGQYLKQFVHEGTYLLIFSILISIALVLYYFRGNLNFYPRNKLLQLLAYVWLVQNAVLSFSVAIRNFLYIQHFALAYKRIGVILFLILCIYGLLTVFQKVKYRKSESYLFKKNAYALIFLLIISSLFNWDAIIARYNFSHYENSFLHLNFMATLSDKCLPIIERDIAELHVIESYQSELFSFRSKYMSAEEYSETIEARKKLFIGKWESKSFLSWNYAEYRAYSKLIK